MKEEMESERLIQKLEPLETLHRWSRIQKKM